MIASVAYRPSGGSWSLIAIPTIVTMSAGKATANGLEEELEHRPDKREDDEHDELRRSRPDELACGFGASTLHLRASAARAWRCGRSAGTRSRVRCEPRLGRPGSSPATAAATGAS